MDTQPRGDQSRIEDESQNNVEQHSSAQTLGQCPTVSSFSSHASKPCSINRVPILQTDADSEQTSQVDQLVLENLKERQKTEDNNYFDYINNAMDSFVLDDPEIDEDQALQPEPKTVTKTNEDGWNNPIVKSPKELVVILATLLFEAWLIGLFNTPATQVETPVIAEVHSPLNAEIARLLSEINGIKTELNDYKVELAGKALNIKAPVVKRWQYLTQEHLFAGSQLAQADQDLSTAQSHIQTGHLEQAHATLIGVHTNYQYLLDQFHAAGKVYPAEKQANQANRAWFQRKQRYSLQDTEFVAPAIASEALAQTMEVSGDFSLAESYWLMAEQLWKLSFLAVADRVTEVNNWLAKQEAQKKAALEAERLAAIEAQRLAEEAEAKRLADLAAAAQLAAIQAEKLRVEEAAKKKEQQRLVHLAVGNMLHIPAGSYRMGCNGIEEGCPADQQPAREVAISAFKMGESEVTFEQWDACVELGGCRHRPDDEGWGRGNRPVINVNFQDVVEEFIPTLNRYSGRTFRLPTEAEWEYAARAGATTKFAWGDELAKDQANCAKCSSTDDYKKTTEVKTFIPNAFGLYDIHGNVWEWTQDCWKTSYKGSSSNGSAYLGAEDKDELWIYNECQKRVLRGGSWDFSDSFLRLDRRNWNPVDTRSNSYGFRLVEDI